MCKNRFVGVEVNSQEQKEKKKKRWKLGHLFTFSVPIALPFSTLLQSHELDHKFFASTDQVKMLPSVNTEPSQSQDFHRSILIDVQSR
jgi:hypothetical protein